MTLSGIEKLARLPPRLVLQRVRAWLAGRARPAVLNREMPCFFTLSTGRTGTKTLAELLNRSPDATVYHEPHPYLSALAKLAYDSRYAQMEGLVETFLASRELLLRNAWASGLVYGETGPYVTFLAPVIAQALPNSKFIHLVRDPAAVVRSGLNRRWYQGHRYDARRITPRREDPAAANWTQWSPLEKIIWLWAETNRFVAAFLKTIEPHRYMRLKAEDLFSGSAEVLRKIFEFLEIAPISPRSAASVLARRLNRQRRPGPPLDFWHADWAKRFEAIAGAEIRALGYAVPGAAGQTAS